MADASPAPSTYTEAWLPGPSGTKFYTRTYAPPPSAGPPKAAVLFIHGFVEHCARYEWAHGELAAKGVAVFTYDQRGFGRTALDAEHKSKRSGYGKTSWREQLGDMEFWVRYVSGEVFPGVKLFLMGQSMVSLSEFVVERRRAEVACWGL